MRDLATFRGPETSRLKAQLSSEDLLAKRPRRFSPPPSQARSENQANTAHQVKNTLSGVFYLVGDEGLEPPTSSLSVTRSNQLS